MIFHHPFPSIRLSLAAGLALGIALSGLPAAAQLRVGVNAGVNPAATGAAPGGVSRSLVIGQPVVYNERVETGAAGQIQIAFLDESSLSVGPNSDLVIDRFVYNPDAGTGMIAASATRGVFRYVGGRISKLDRAVSVRTPAGTIGIRGGVFLLDLRSSGQLAAIFVYGRALTVTGLNGVTQTALRPGYEIAIARPGESPSAPFPAPVSQISGLLALLDGETGGHGGASVVPTDATVAQGFGDIVPAGAPPAEPSFPSLPPIFIGGEIAPVRRVQPAPMPIQTMTQPPAPVQIPAPTPVQIPAPTMTSPTFGAASPVRGGR